MALKIPDLDHELRNVLEVEDFQEDVFICEEGLLRLSNFAINGIQRWTSPIPAQANSPAAIIALDALTATPNFGDLAMVDVAGVPTYFKHNGVTWEFAY